MTIPNPYFKNVPGYGDLKMEQIIVDYIYPLLSVLIDDLGKRYLCMCFDTRGSQQWLITPVANRTLASLLRNEITLSSPFENPCTKKIVVFMDYKTREETFQSLSYGQVPKEYLPEAGEYLDAEPGEWESYIKTLSFIRPSTKRSKGMIYYCGDSKGSLSAKWGEPPHQHRKAGRYVACAAR